MGKDHRGYPSGANKTESGTGIPTRMDPENRPNDIEKTEKYTDDDQNVSDNVRTGHPNRNTDKPDRGDGPAYS
ncbi:MAG: hypothetical protein EOO11_14065 [Chitinophagaceae bacterium]|nr:MAG: hypothetical protein EOO11_14065 [Chitinophagaceae bacterium]